MGTVGAAGAWGRMWLSAWWVPWHAALGVSWSWWCRACDGWCWSWEPIGAPWGAAATVPILCWGWGGCFAMLRVFWGALGSTQSTCRALAWAGCGCATRGAGSPRVQQGRVPGGAGGSEWRVRGPGGWGAACWCWAVVEEPQAANLCLNVWQAWLPLHCWGAVPCWCVIPKGCSWCWGTVRACACALLLAHWDGKGSVALCMGGKMG